MTDGPSEAEQAAPPVYPVPTPGRIVMYRLSEFNVGRIRDRWQHSERPGNMPNVGDEFPMIIVRAWGDQPDSYVNGQVLLDGPDVEWATSAKVGEEPGTFRWPIRS